MHTCQLEQVTTVEDGDDGNDRHHWMSGKYGAQKHTQQEQMYK
jgi:hypothetical protein